MQLTRGMLTAVEKSVFASLKIYYDSLEDVRGSYSKHNTLTSSYIIFWFAGFTTPVITYYSTALYPNTVSGKTRNKDLLRKPCVHGWPL